MKISQRLQHINHMVQGHYDHIWDCCCDHGLLGMMLLKRNTANQVHFVDCVAPLMLQLTQDLQRFFPKQAFSTGHSVAQNTLGISQWQVHCLNAADLPIEQTDITNTHLIIIAGVDGKLLIELVQALISRHGSRQIEFILCPVHHNYYVRHSLAKLGFFIQAETLLEENRRFYEVLHVTLERPCHGHPVTLTGSLMWEDLDKKDLDLAKRYLSQVIAHYQRMPSDLQVPYIIHAYQSQLAQISNAF
ncbi:tRNA (adenine(22)-N(1))-methyltransferase [Shewanella putrefaciens]|uniref:tRNA (Adenine(22)-N(1))-methyltransferase TrmK n=1 Tax=Shewanella putrefaciens TaxID=24 RepID=A0ABX8XGM7_SHEPU|nr:tRNA (adenine(22)-N(1))-methyltransferase TrmK [Shewanella putrefaciens]AVV82355.1 SAM-dependent methyltransferase [Shewanella putrefaciens]MCT8941755.1 tRNA (adenine(22)-N(1))-methyltransferase TrmK [Shewanella putrefaciens]QSE51175.1 tRNA (adenine(22)-N(1))-methyltransferase TrmK [Shewanella putrefaciens]QYX74586.1 tRNA (adenine(22)-N(1))-methyltransferase TrmK [Shewanella putrefaciens]